MHFEIAARAYLGDRELQEDSCGVVLDGGAPRLNQSVEAQAQQALLVICDGVGGQDSGEAASHIALSRFATVAGGLSPSPRLKLDVALSEAVQAVRRACLEDADGALDMATTLLGVWLDANGLSWVSVGDSPLLLIRDGRRLQLNEDHSDAPLVRKQRRRTPLALLPDTSNVIHHALSVDDLEHRDLAPAPVPLACGDVVIVASDGLDVLAAATIIQACAQVSAGEVADALLDAVVRRAKPYQDNTTVIVARVLP